MRCERAGMDVPRDALETGSDILKVIDERLLRPVIGAQPEAGIGREAERVDQLKAILRLSPSAS